MNRKQTAIIVLVAAVLVGSVIYFTVGRKSMRGKNVKQITNESPASTAPIANDGPVSPISGLPCENWNRRPIAVMQPADVQARPAAGFSEADMVIEMPAFTASVTRLLGIYVCDIPKEIGGMRSARHDYMHLAKGLDAVFIHWGGSIFAYNLLNRGVIDHLDCPGQYCGRWPMTGTMRLEDTGHITQEKVLKMMEDKGFRREGNFSGYPHAPEAVESERPEGGRLRVAFKKPYDVEYDYDKATNSYLRTWGDNPDTDRNNGQRIAPKNVVVVMARSEQIMLSQNYAGNGLEDPWATIPEVKKTGNESINGRYNNVQIGDPWYDTSDSGEAYYYMNGREHRGTWKKDRKSMDSKLFFYDQSGKEIQFVPGQIWVEILEPGQTLKWEPV